MLTQQTDKNTQHEQFYGDIISTCMHQPLYS